MAALVTAAALVAAQPPPTTFRLPDVARPTRYHLDLTVLPSEPTFHGSAIIDVDLVKRTDVVWLDAKDLRVDQVSVTVASRPRTVRWHVSGAEERLAVELGKPMGPGPLTIAIRYVGQLSDTGNVGAYRKKSGSDWYVYTSFTPIDARRAFPCFDEPGYKAPWELVLHVRRDEVAVANAPAIATRDEPDSMQRVQFAPTQPLASEVVAFAVGPFDVVDAGVAGENQIPVRIIAPRGRGADAAAARTATAEILARLEQYTGIAYPWAKLDHIAVLDLPFGATENPGLITYQADELLAAPGEDTQQHQEAMRSVMTHEMAHQWFGNLVTQAWWNDVWLSEGFATWLQAKISDLELPPFERHLSITDTRNLTMLGDSAHTRPVRVEMHSRQETEDVYDRVVYIKGGSILEMLDDWLGPAVFQRALHRYLTDHRFGNATSSDLATAIKEESGVDVGPVLFGFLDRPGAPVLRFSIAATGGRGGGGGGTELDVDQGPNPWSVPVCVHTESAARHCEVVGTSHAELHLVRRSAWAWPNAYGSGYYRSVLPTTVLDSLVDRGYSQLEEPERLALVGDLRGLTRTGDVPAATAMAVLPRLMRDPDAQVRAHVAAIALDLAVVVPDSARGMYTAWLRRAMGIAAPVPGQAQSVAAFFRDKP